MENHNTLYALTEQMTAIEAMLEDNGGELTPELESMWDETRESLVQKVDNYNALVQKLDAYATNIKAEVKRLQALQKTADNSLKRIKDHIKAVMEANGISTLEGKLCKMSLTHTTATETDDELILKPYEDAVEALRKQLPVYVNVDLSVSKAAIKEAANALPDGVTLRGVTFVPHTSLRIK